MGCPCLCESNYDRLKIVPSKVGSRSLNPYHATEIWVFAFSALRPCWGARGGGEETVVADAPRRAGIVTGLLFACLEDMRQQGFGYAIIGGVGPAAYYSKAVGAAPIEGSEPGVYRGLLDSPRFGILKE